MDKIRIKGGKNLRGEIKIGGAKNAALPLMSASLLTDKELIISNLPRLDDVVTMSNLLRHHGVIIDQALQEQKTGADDFTLSFSASKVTDTTAPYDLVRRMRASVLVLGPLVAREGVARVSVPGGCAIGSRPIDLHLAGLEALGAEIVMESGYVEARAPGGLTGGRVVFPNTSVGATENILMAAALAKGQTEIFNAAREPEIEDLALCLIEMGADISGIGSEKLTVNGRDILDGAHYTVLPDRIEAGTYAMAAAMTKGDILLRGARVKSMHAVIDKLRLAGVRIIETDGGLRVFADNRLEGVDVITEPYPGFPTDLQAQMTAMMSTANGAAMITETIFENRFMHIPELARMGANVTVHGASSLIRGVDNLAGAPVMATDLRASASLVLAGLIAEGETLVDRVYHIDRGYERIEEKLVSCGAEIERIKE